MWQGTTELDRYCTNLHKISIFWPSSSFSRYVPFFANASHFFQLFCENISKSIFPGIYQLDGHVHNPKFKNRTGRLLFFRNPNRSMVQKKLSSTDTKIFGWILLSIFINLFSQIFYYGVMFFLYFYSHISKTC